MWINTSQDTELLNLIPEAASVFGTIDADPIMNRPGINLYTYRMKRQSELELFRPVVWDSRDGNIAFFGFSNSAGKPDTMIVRERQLMSLPASIAIRNCWLHNHCMSVGGEIVFDSNEGTEIDLAYHALAGHARGQMILKNLNLIKIKASVLNQIEIACSLIFIQYASK